MRGQFPLEPEIALEPLLRVVGDERDEQDAVPNLMPNFRIPLIAVLESAVGIEPDLDPGGAQAVREPLCDFPILRGIAQEDSSAG